MPEETPKKAAVKKAAVRKTAAKKAPAKKAAKKTARKTVRKTANLAPEPVITTIIAKIDAGFGNALFIRGSSSGLTWDQGLPMENRESDEWVWQSNAVTSELEFKVLLNDQVWAVGPNGVVFPGATVVFEPAF